MIKTLKIKSSFFLSGQNSELLEDGSLLITLNYDENQYLKISSWSTGCQTSFCVGDTKDINGFNAVKPPPINLITVPHMNEKLPVYKYLRSIPEEIKKNIGTFFYKQIELLQVCSKSGYAQDLLKSNPLLLWLWVSEKSLFLQEYKEKDLELFLGKKQKKILSDVLEKDVSTFEVKLLKKIVIFEGREDEIGMIRRSFICDDLKRLKHFNVVPVTILGLASGHDVYPFVPSLYNKFNELSTTLIMKTDIADIFEKIMHITDMEFTDSVNLGDSRFHVMKCKSRKQLDKLHDKVLHKYRESVNKINIKEGVETFFPSPPIKDCQNLIEAIRSKSELDNETIEMNHCIASLSYLLEKGEDYFYRVLQPERASLHIRYNSDYKRYELHECRLINNEEPSEDTIELIYDWLDEGNREIKMCKEE